MQGTTEIGAAHSTLATMKHAMRSPATGQSVPPLHSFLIVSSQTEQRRDSRSSEQRPNTSITLLGLHLRNTAWRTASGPLLADVRDTQHFMTLQGPPRLISVRWLVFDTKVHLAGTTLPGGNGSSRAAAHATGNAP
jgi:hypothetical protein